MCPWLRTSWCVSCTSFGYFMWHILDWFQRGSRPPLAMSFCMAIWKACILLYLQTFLVFVNVNASEKSKCSLDNMSWTKRYRTKKQVPVLAQSHEYKQPNCCFASSIGYTNDTRFQSRRASPVAGNIYCVVWFPHIGSADKKWRSCFGSLHRSWRAQLNHLSWCQGISRSNAEANKVLARWELFGVERVNIPLVTERNAKRIRPQLKFGENCQCGWIIVCLPNEDALTASRCTSPSFATADVKHTFSEKWAN